MRPFALAALAALLASTALAQDADRIFIGGPMLTMNDAQPRAEAVAVAVKDGVIIAVGGADEIIALRGAGTDAPVTFPDSMRVLDATVTRRSRSGDIIGPDQRVDVITALKSMTIWPAHQYFEADRKGSIEVGKLADLVILSGDPTAIDPETLDTLTVAETIKEGTTVYSAGEKEGRLGYQPRRDGTDPFARFLRQATVHYESGPLFWGTGIRPTDRFSAQHFSNCVARFLAAAIGADGAYVRQER